MKICAMMIAPILQRTITHAPHFGNHQCEGGLRVRITCAGTYVRPSMRKRRLRRHRKGYRFARHDYSRAQIEAQGA